MDLGVDINGYFAPVGGQNAPSMYPTPPCRVLDTRTIGQGQPFSGTLNPPVDVVTARAACPCRPSLDLNATVVPAPTLPYLTLWPDGEQQPVVFTLTLGRGRDLEHGCRSGPRRRQDRCLAQETNQLILDISGYFAP